MSVSLIKFILNFHVVFSSCHKLLDCLQFFVFHLKKTFFNAVLISLVYIYRKLLNVFCLATKASLNAVLFGRSDAFGI